MVFGCADCSFFILKAVFIISSTYHRTEWNSIKDRRAAEDQRYELVELEFSNESVVWKCRDKIDEHNIICCFTPKL
jgi:hypothetical protein